MRRILIAGSAGFCFGVKRAISLANEAAGTGEGATPAKGQIYSLGPLIHNPQVKVGIVVQTTQSFENLMKFVSAALAKFTEVRVYNTICHATTLRQKESTVVAGKADIMIVLGGYNSANTRRLAQICGEINPRTHHIETAAELSPDLVAGTTCVGVTAGASTPQWIIDGLVAKIREIWRGEEIGVVYYK